MLWSLPTNDGTNACTFLRFLRTYRIWTAENRGDLQGKVWEVMVPPMFKQIVVSDLKVINKLKEKKCYDALKCMELHGR